MVKKITTNEFSEATNANTAVIDFSATWCGPCKMMAPVFHEVSEELAGQAEFFNVDVNESETLAAKFGIISIPAIVVLKKGEKAGMQIGFQSKSALESFIKSNL